MIKTTTMETHGQKVFSFDELSEEAKQKTIKTFREVKDDDDATDDMVIEFIRSHCFKFDKYGNTNQKSSQSKR
jgi:hypothetical protein